MKTTEYKCDECSKPLDYRNAATVDVILRQGLHDDDVIKASDRTYSFRGRKEKKLHLCPECFGEDCKMDWKGERLKSPSDNGWVRRILIKLGLKTKEDEQE